VAVLNNPKREALRRVRHLIKTNQCTFICHALDEVALNSKVLRHACEQLKAYVAEALKPSSVLQNWQAHNKMPDRGSDQRREDRLAWIDWMLNEEINAD
jgi:copper oxidase (laccase) domain-containing protein